jgi:hypothetical protein
MIGDNRESKRRQLLIAPRFGLPCGWRGLQIAPGQESRRAALRLSSDA